MGTLYLPGSHTGKPDCLPVCQWNLLQAFSRHKCRSPDVLCCWWHTGYPAAICNPETSPGPLSPPSPTLHTPCSSSFLWDQQVVQDTTGGWATSDQRLTMHSKPEGRCAYNLLSVRVHAFPLTNTNISMFLKEVYICTLRIWSFCKLFCFNFYDSLSRLAWVDSASDGWPLVTNHRQDSSISVL